MGLAIRSNFKQKDIIGRIGGDEFIVLLCEMPSIKILDKRCNELLKTLDRTYESNGNKLLISNSFGIDFNTNSHARNSLARQTHRLVAACAEKFKR